MSILDSYIKRQLKKKKKKEADTLKLEESHELKKKIYQINALGLMLNKLR